MFFVVAKVLGFFALPSNDMLSLGLIGLALMSTRFRRAGQRLLLPQFFFLAGFGFLHLANW